MFWSSLYSFLVFAIGSLAFRLMAALGIGVVTYTGISLGLEWIEDEVIAQAGELPALGFSLLQLTGAGEAVGILLSAVSIRLMLAGLTASGLTRWRLGAGG